MRAKDLVAVRFVRKNAPYNVGEIAGFPKAVADRMVNQKRAVYYVPEEEKPAEPEKKAEEKPAPKKKKAPATKKPAAKKSKSKK
jgi:hypothetical protein